jgi:cell division protease FtsH
VLSAFKFRSLPSSFIKESKYIQKINDVLIKNSDINSFKKYPISQKYYEKYIKRLNSQNISIQNEEILGNDDLFSHLPEENVEKLPGNETFPRGYRIIINKNLFSGFNIDGNIEENNNNEEDDVFKRMRGYRSKKGEKSENFEVMKSSIKFKDVGGYDSVKNELYQCIDMLQNYTKYSKYNVRVPKGLIFEGPPGNGKTLIAKALAGEANNAFIPVSGAEFQDKYIGVGSSKIRELFDLAKKNIPCIIFIDEIDALGRSRGNDGQSSSVERDNTLNELLIALDGFKNSTGIFVIGATNRADLLDKALLRPGRMDKRVFIGNPDEKTRRAIIDIHSTGKPREKNVSIEELIDITSGFSGAQIENILNEAMLNALRYDREEFSNHDIDIVYNKMLAGWQPTDHQFTNDIIDHIAIHELGHAIVGLFSKHHVKMSKVVINLSSPTSPAYTVFENSNSNIYTREALFEHLMILLSGRIAEEVFYGVSVTTGAINDFEEAFKLADKMITYYGLGERIIYPSNSEKYKEMIDNEISRLIEDAYHYSEFIIQTSRDFIFEGAELLKEKKTIKAEELIELMNTKYYHLSNIISK